MSTRSGRLFRTRKRRRKSRGERKVRSRRRRQELRDRQAALVSRLRGRDAA